MNAFIVPLFVTALAVSAPSQRQPVAPTNLFEEFKTICLDGDGDPDVVEELALQRGYGPSQHLVPDDLFQGASIHVWSKELRGIEWRVVTQMDRRMWRVGGEATHHNRCFVAAREGRQRNAMSAVQAHLGFRPFLHQRTNVFAWTSGPNGARQRLSQTIFEGRGPVYLTEQRGLRMILVREHDGLVMLTYLAPSRHG